MSNIRETLAQLDHRLDDLRRQVARLADEPGTTAEPGPSRDTSGFSVARLPADGAALSVATARPEAGHEIQELLAACDRLLREARELMGAPGTEQARPAFFEGTVALVALGANLLQTIQVLEDSLTRARGVSRAYVRRAHAGEVRVEVTLAGGVDLVGELNRVIPFPFAVRSATREEIVISLEGGDVDL